MLAYHIRWSGVDDFKSDLNSDPYSFIYSPFLSSKPDKLIFECRTED